MNTKVTSIDSGIRRRKATLESKVKDLLTLSGDRESLEIQPTADPLDQIRSNTDRDMAVETLNHQARLIHEIHFVLDRIEEGSYLCCEHCEVQIPVKRLNTLPWARTCVSCQSATEAETHHGGAAFHSAA
jgi:DnaK suppressor protein